MRKGLSSAHLQAESEQRPHKLSYHVSVKGDAADKAVSELESKLKAAGTALTCSASITFALLCPCFIQRDSQLGRGCQICILYISNDVTHCFPDQQNKIWPATLTACLKLRWRNPSSTHPK